MTQRELNRQVAQVTGESIGTIAEMGFVPLTTMPYERKWDREPLVVDWGKVDEKRIFILP